MNQQSTSDQRSEDPRIPDALPVLPLSDIVVFPLAVAPLAIPKGAAGRLIDDVMGANRLLVLVGHTGDEQSPNAADLPKIGTAVVIHQLLRAPDGSLRLFVQGLERVSIIEYTSVEPYLVARIEPAPEKLMTGIEGEGQRRAVVDLFRKLVSLNDNVPKELADSVEALADPRQVAYFVASAVPFETVAKQEILELDQIDRKLSRLVELLQHEIAVREIGKKITSQTEERVSKGQREYILREQLRSIQRELGEGSEDGEVDALRKRIDEADLPEEARREAERELDRLGSIPEASPEHGIIRTYLEWMASLPWNKSTGGEIDVKRAREILDADHYGLDRIKRRITEYLAVRKLREERLAAQVTDGEDADVTEKENPAREPILCFVGPPGVGKTSLGISIARAMGRKFTRISLGGIHDESEIRGHRRTYIGALPGRIIQALKRIEARDPVIMLDEIDKLGNDWRGDPSSALLEVLDPAQNNAFVDTYLGVPFDLSQVFFIATANTLETIPGPLLDRMEIVQLAGYTDDEKVAIAQNYLVPKQIKAHGLRVEEVSFEPAALRTVVRGYTREAGVRNLEREIANICRKVAKEIAEGRTDPVVVTPDTVMTYLERPRFVDEVRERTDRPGVATGLAWTPVGGDVLFVEAAIMPSKNEQMILTGMLGDVMRESVQAAMSYVRSNARLFGIDPNVFDGKAIHVHVPAGAIPKDGPSAGVTMVTALVSLLTNRPVQPDVAMTGEITLRGKVLPVGGIKEKILAAHRLGVKCVILPKQNERDLEDVPAELRQQMTFVLADTASDVVSRALGVTIEPNVGAAVA